MNPEQDPLPSLFSKISELVQKIQNNKKPLGELSPDILAKLTTMEQAMQAFVDINSLALQDAGIDIEKLAAELSKTPMSLKDKRLLDRAKSLEGDVKYLHLNLSKIGESGQTSGSEPSEKEKKKSKARQKRFKRLGGDGWMRL